MVLHRGADGALSGTPSLELRGVRRTFGAVLAVDDVSLAVRAGTVHALLGENGAGKSTLMRVAFGLLRADRGDVLRNGTTLRLRSPSDAIRAGIGMVHQHYSLVRTMTAAENVVLGGGALPGWRYHRSAAEQLVRALSQESGLAVDASAAVESMPVSAQQRLEILKALARRATLLILDEPTAVLAPAERDELLAWLRRYVSAGNAAVLITHKLNEALAIADDVTVLRRGRRVLSTKSRGTTPDEVTAAMLGSDVAASEARPGTSPRGTVIARLSNVLARSFEERQPLREATLEVRAGEIVGVAAIEGAGQHALLRVLARRIEPGAGNVQLPEEIAFIPEDRHRDALAVDLSLTENVALRGAGTRHGILRWRDVLARTEQLMRSHDVRADSADNPARMLSGGNQQKLVVARELEGAPALVVAENPTRGLDVHATAAVHRRLRDAATAGAGVVVYSSDLDEVLELADRVVVVHAGSLSEHPVDRTVVGAAMLGQAT